MSARFDGRTVLVTGASRGLGAAIASAFADDGAFVGVGYRRRVEDAEAVLASLRARGHDGVALALDLADAASIEAAVARLTAARGAIDVLVNNAAIARDEPFPMASENAWSEVIDVNLSGAFRVSRAIVRSMMARKRGAIVNIGSVAGANASPGQASYAAAKGGLIALTRTMAAELAPHGVRVNAVVPGLLSTGMAARLDHRVVARHRERIPLGRVGTAEEVARVVAFVASDEASYLVGQALVVDGGLTL